MLGRRDPSSYGGLSLGELESRIYQWARDVDSSAQCKQTNNEGEYVNWFHEALDWADGVIVNPARGRTTATRSATRSSCSTAPDRRGAPLQRRRARGVAAQLRHLRPGRAPHHRQGADGIPGGDRMAVADTSERAGRAAARVARGAAARHDRRQRPLPDRVRELERGAARRRRARCCSSPTSATPRRHARSTASSSCRRSAACSRPSARRSTAASASRRARSPTPAGRRCGDGGLELVPRQRARRGAARGQGRGRARDDPRGGAHHRRGLRCVRRGALRRPHRARRRVAHGAALPRARRARRSRSSDRRLGADRRAAARPADRPCRRAEHDRRHRHRRAARRLRVRLHAHVRDGRSPRRARARRTTSACAASSPGSTRCVRA